MFQTPTNTSISWVGRLPGDPAIAPGVQVLGLSPDPTYFPHKVPPLVSILTLSMPWFLCNPPFHELASGSPTLGPFSAEGFYHFLSQFMRQRITKERLGKTQFFQFHKNLFHTVLSPKPSPLRASRCPFNTPWLHDTGVSMCTGNNASLLFTPLTLLLPA